MTPKRGWLTPLTTKRILMRRRLVEPTWREDPSRQGERIDKVVLDTGCTCGQREKNHA